MTAYWQIFTLLADLHPDTIAALITAIAKLICIGAQQLQSTPAGPNVITIVRRVASVFTSWIESCARIQELDFQPVARSMDRHRNLIVAACSPAMFQRVRGKLGNAKPSTENDSLARAP